jgi:GH15 family glucan-1,4-alpha-glucosidase
VSCSAYPPIGDYALVGDCHTAALIARDGSVDWLCPGAFDAPAVFCRVLDVHNGGSMRTRPTGEFSVERRYRGATNVLETTFSTAGGRVRLTDLMPVHQRTSGQGYDVGTSERFLRLVEGLSGEVELRLDFRPTFDYARAATELYATETGAVARAGEQHLRLACPGVRLEANGTACLRVAAGECRWSC